MAILSPLFPYYFKCTICAYFFQDSGNYNIKGAYNAFCSLFDYLLYLQFYAIIKKNAMFPFFKSLCLSILPLNDNWLICKNNLFTNEPTIHTIFAQRISEIPIILIKPALLPLHQNLLHSGLLQRL